MFRKSRSILIALAIMLGACAPAATPMVAPTNVPAVVPTSAPTVAPTPAPQPVPVMLTDRLGHTVTLNSVPKRIISIAPSNTELLFVVGAGDQVVGREELSDYPEAAKKIASIGSVYGKINTEAIVALKPDLILAAEINPPEQVKTLQDLGLTVYYLSNPTDFEGLYANIKVVGQLTGHDIEAQKSINSTKARFDAVVTKVSVSSFMPKVYYELDATDPTKPYTTGTGTFVDLLIKLAGGQNIGAALKDQYAQISAEEIVKQNPDVIVLGDAAYGVSIDSIGARAGWASIAAVKNKAVYAFDDNLVSRPGPRLIDGLEQLAKLLHPDLFK
ncbi:MAG TPA: helical backbone metal receptor [Anaerolineae bacterium]|nr:helical backbone metal receptor [Anaerolineae bacterium]